MSIWGNSETAIDNINKVVGVTIGNKKQSLTAKYMYIIEQIKKLSMKNNKGK